MAGSPLEQMTVPGLDGKWMREDIAPGLSVLHEVVEVYEGEKSEFQYLEVAKLKTWENCLILDGKMQSSNSDEFVYHESLVHPAMLMHPNPKNVYIGGGGEGGTLREVLRHKSVEKCVMADIDAKVVEYCKEHVHMDKFEDGKSAFDDKRTDLRIDCARHCLETTDMKFDVIILDLADPVEAGPCYFLYTTEFYTLCKEKLNPNGILVTQSGPAAINSGSQVLTPVNNTLKQVFSTVTAYSSHVPSFMDVWGFNVATLDAAASPADADPETVNKDIKLRIDGELKHYDGVAHRGMFSLSKRFRQMIADEKRVLNLDNPTYLF